MRGARQAGTPGAVSPEGPGLRWQRLVRRCLFLGLLLVAGDRLLGLVLPPRGDDPFYRPGWWSLPRCVAQIQAFHRAHPDRPIIVFLGPSTAWGAAASRGKAIPEAFGTLLRQRYRHGPLSRARVFNLCLLGNTAAGDYYTLRAVAGVATATYWQLHYYPFAERGWLDLHPWLVPLLGRWPSAQERRDLGGEWAERELTWDAACSLWLAQHWPLYRDRFALRALFYRSEQTPATAGYEAYESWLEGTGREHRPVAAARLASNRQEAWEHRFWNREWLELPPRLRQDYARKARLNYHCPPIARGNRNLAFVRRTLALARQYRLPLFTYTAVFNQPVMEPGWVQGEYQRNMSVVKGVFAQAGMPLVDYNDLPPRPAHYFHDFDHLVDAGTTWQARQLLEDSAPFLEESVRARR